MIPLTLDLIYISSPAFKHVLIGIFLQICPCSIGYIATS